MSGARSLLPGAPCLAPFKTFDGAQGSRLEPRTPAERNAIENVSTLLRKIVDNAHLRMSRPNRITHLLLILGLALTHVTCLAAVVLQAANPPVKTAPASAKTDPGSPNPEKHDKEANPKVTPDAKVGLLGALAGAIVGRAIAWFVGIKSANRAAVLADKRDERLEREEAKTVRAMLDVEIEMNLQMLREEKDRLDDQPEDATAFEWMARHPCPEWSTVVWERSVLHVHRALSPKETLAVQKLYNSLHSLTVARESVTSILARGQHHEAEVSFRRAKDLTNKVLEAGNPLRPTASC